MRIIRIVAALISIVCLPLLTHAADIKFTSSTQYLWYQDLLDTIDKDEVAQYLRLNVGKLDKQGKLSMYGYGRVTKQVHPDEDTLGRLYYLYFEYKDALNNHLDLRAGRNYVSTAAISGTIDGLSVNAKNLGPVGITAFGGRHVIFDEKQEIGTGDDTLAGASVYVDTVKYTHMELSYGNKYTNGDLARENVGFNFSTTPHEIVNIYGRFKYDTVSDTSSELLLGAKLAPVKKLTLRGEFYKFTPTFDKDSFFNFFNVNNYKEFSIDAEYALTANYRVHAKYANEDYSDNASADRYRAGILARPINDLTLNVEYEKRNGFPGSIDGIAFNGEYRIKKAAILAGIDYDDFRRDDSRQGNAKRFWAAAHYSITKQIMAVVKF
ncbi:MAG TPA: hypothetical protein VJ508_14655, partial [Saprospiraceae bacterium]|nr:hypothetical protein [Saprospiraceae bacterium]